MIATKSVAQRLYGSQVPAEQDASGVRQNQILSKFSKPLVLQPSAPSRSLPVQAAGTAGTEPNHEARSPCTFAFSDHSIHLYAQFGCLASVASIVVSAQPVAPSSGTVLAIGCLLATSVLTWNGHEPEATTPSFVNS